MEIGFSSDSSRDDDPSPVTESQKHIGASYLSAPTDLLKRWVVLIPTLMVLQRILRQRWSPTLRLCKKMRNWTRCQSKKKMELETIVHRVKGGI
mmetsp:Transcript_17313/g.25218  ORF Transcript_17313/g.25218 Transcript_17313/m.25218 type:complete len:94 (+) Transcript_17313:1408-1689(+)